LIDNILEQFEESKKGE
ncbi:TPA: DUF1617 family protein, partial [Streptococcus pyogenes]|nr:DUF1617 family protein [Streptococcus pyogenes]HEQ1325782.1 DUF1617 family protein [Streptococcus pyogenes]